MAFYLPPMAISQQREKGKSILDTRVLVMVILG
jgi:hypothetical protein